ncbi:ferritin family protein [Kosmotoga pacifica]|uniref:Rubrerythrin diiron-binding domain-containing protein n=1 Tax=Kosmotoga pacifica TaxID=1330330 RepID=A0A0G2Z6E5_9BACT|nr:ferritin family protein [Kosmotoga pacifica]AKI97170.1 hypothetical protein IX53_04360 [Kosmotoga pacifica]
MGITKLLEIAIGIEKKGYSYYTKLANRSSGYNKVLFKRLAEKEKEHMKCFHDLIKEYKDESGSSAAYEIEDVDLLKSLAEISVFPLENAEKLSDDLGKAIKIVVQIEEGSIEFYWRLIEYIPKKNLLERIIKEEEKHLKELLEVFHDYV